MDFREMFEQVEQLVQEYIDTADKVAADEVGLDRRSGMVYVTKECIFAHKDANRSLRYYGGFEYVSAEFVKHIGDYVFYMLEDEYGETCDRVQDAIDRYHTERAT